MKNHLYSEWDYLTVGSIGFHQLGQPFAFEKMKVERSVLLKLINFDPQFKVPENLQSVCNFSVKKFNHDFGTYEEIVLNFKSDYIDIQGIEDDSENSLYFQFWDFVDGVENLDLEAAKYLEQCYTLYLKRHAMLIVLNNEERAKTA
jgi:hypothetical protein